MWVLVSKKPRRFNYIIQSVRQMGDVESGFCTESEIAKVVDNFNRYYGNDQAYDIKFQELMELEWEE